VKSKAKAGKTKVLTLAGARRLIRKNRAHPSDWYLASSLLCISKRSTFADLLACLKRFEAKFRAARVLHERTGRPLKNGKAIMSINDWRRYLKAEGKI